MTRAIRPRPRREAQEFGPGKADYVVCPDCGAVYDHKRWKASFAQVRNVSETKRLSFHRCPACAMVRNRMFEGRVVARGIPAKRVDEALAHIRHVGQRAMFRDPLDRIIAFRRRGRDLEVTTTENQLALRIGKELKQLLGGVLDIRWSHEEDIVRVYLKLP